MVHARMARANGLPLWQAKPSRSLTFTLQREPCGKILCCIHVMTVSWANPLSFSWGLRRVFPGEPSFPAAANAYRHVVAQTARCLPERQGICSTNFKGYVRWF
jgi:hypothetical protein